jgi:guanine deaminase
VKHGTYIQTHINESRAEIEACAELFPAYSSYTHIYEAMGLLTSKTILAHNIHASDEELSLCDSYGCVVAHCPESNIFLRSGRFPFERYRATTVRFGLGSDVAAGSTLSMFHGMRCMTEVYGLNLHPFVPLFHATFGGAQAISLGHEIGNFTPGKRADFFALKIASHVNGGKSLTDLSAVEIASMIVSCGRDTDVAAVWSDGIQLNS